MNFFGNLRPISKIIFFTSFGIIVCLATWEDIRLRMENADLHARLGEKEEKILNLKHQISYQLRATEKLRLFAEARLSECRSHLNQFQDCHD